ncbi:MAG: glycosyltransferase, partial [Candidatus Thermoplasmatota archaeon]|nr:glycosyltransferase [Candidatus Thermoplasmatota archaeon]
IAAADAGIHLGIHDYELNPFKVLEYMACGRPVIGTKRGLSEIIGASGGGIAVDPLEHERSADAVCDFLGDEERIAAAVKNARKYVSEKHSWDKSASLLRSVLKGVIA